jgi:hypothetical protein
MHRTFGGDLGKWFRWLLDPSEWEKATCWRQWDSNPFCNGAARAKEYILSLPIVLVLEVGDSLGSSWKVPATLLPLGSKYATQGVKYVLAAEIYTNYTVELGSSSHFIARYVTPDGTRIFDYDGMQHDRHAKHRRGAKPLGWMSGQSNKLRDLPTGYRLVAIVYDLEGGIKGQQVFSAARRKAAPWGLQLENSTTNQLFPWLAKLVQPHLRQMSGEERERWASRRRQSEAREYVMNNSAPQQPLQNDKVTDTGRFQPVFVELDNDGDTQSSKHADRDSIDDLILETLESTAPTQPKRQQRVTSLTSSDSSDSTTSCPVNCYGCGEISDGDDRPDEVQCSSCGFWSHLNCQPEHGKIDWNDPQVTFTCQGCRKRTKTQLCVSSFIFFH